MAALAIRLGVDRQLNLSCQGIAEDCESVYLAEKDDETLEGVVSYLHPVSSSSGAAPLLLSPCKRAVLL